MHSHSLAALPHSDIELVLPDIYMVTGTNIVEHDGVKLQHSRNMIIVRHRNEISLINTVRLNNAGLKALDELGRVTHILRIGAFHGRDDAFYLDRYPHATYWALPNMAQPKEKITASICELTEQSRLPIPDATLHLFKSSIHPEAFIYIKREGGIIITCDSIKNWLQPDAYFNQSTTHSYTKMGFFGPATISNVFLEATKIQASDFRALTELPYQHLLSAHGPAIIDEAKEQVTASIKRVFS